VLTEEMVLSALKVVEDPEVHKSIVELEMVRRIEIKGDHVIVEIALTISGCPLRTQIEQDVKTALAKVPGIETSEIVLSTMSDEERGQFASKLRGGRAQSHSPLLSGETETRFVAIASGKGGVGKSTVTANLAVALRRLGYKVGVIDADIYGFSLPAIFDIERRQPTQIDNVLFPIEARGIKLMSMGFFVPEKEPVIWRGPMLGKMLRNFFNEVHWGEIDVMLLDLPPGTGDVALDVHQMLPKCKEIIVTTPQAAAAEVAKRAGFMAKRTNHEIIGIVENMSFLRCTRCDEANYVFGKGGGLKLSKELDVPLLGEVPLAVMKVSGESIYPVESEQGEVFERIARATAESIHVPVALNEK